MLSGVRKFLTIRILVRNILTFAFKKVRKKLVRNFGEKKVRKFLIMRDFLTLFSQDGLRVCGDSAAEQGAK
jgi:hypothetical protein